MKSNLFAVSIVIYIIVIQVLSLFFSIGGLMIIHYNTIDIVFFGSALLWLLLTIPVVKLLCYYYMYSERKIILYLYCIIALVMYVGGNRLISYLAEMRDVDSVSVFRFLLYEDLKLIDSALLTLGIIVYRNYLFKD
ncbi:hypothetical protein DVK85_04740 [Flavobacterium arcticum]|uniref:Uncharacterized protein n=1 Tax=Flavobacterium arcticum TaxID=1784713 RepID=A0A345HAG2_9FLAO|nr:hypothetical protein [Flavobacterium arcticum]AXG73572.1 hypothetical protein DVK85_04740 [Flavobacterium arcticum]KAF2513365.1 hypothetical protein E0W72_02795 [Flavobacterium arcticum]